MKKLHSILLFILLSVVFSASAQSLNFDNVAPHPRLLLTKGDVTKMRELPANSASATVVNNKILAVADSYLDVEAVKYQEPLTALSQEVLKRAITPMGSKIKSEVKEGFSNKSESMGICFLEGRPYAEFLKLRGTSNSDGNIIDSNGTVCSRHNGIIHYTIGQRRGEGIPEGKRVVDIAADTNTIIVGEKHELYKQQLYITNCNIIDETELLTATDITIKIRGIGINPTLPVAVKRSGDGYIITTPDKAFSPAKGQPLVLYRNNLVIGGGIVESFE